MKYCLYGDNGGSAGHTQCTPRCTKRPQGYHTEARAQSCLFPTGSGNAVGCPSSRACPPRTRSRCGRRWRRGRTWWVPRTRGFPRTTHSSGGRQCRPVGHRGRRTCHGCHTCIACLPARPAVPRWGPACRSRGCVCVCIQPLGKQATWFQKHENWFRLFSKTRDSVLAGFKNTSIRLAGYKNTCFRFQNKCLIGFGTHTTRGTPGLRHIPV